MKIIVPIKSLISDDSFILNDIQFISNWEVQDYINSLSLINNNPTNMNTVIPDITGFNLDWFNGNMLAICKVNNMTEDDIFGLSHDQTISLISNICEKVNRTLDIIRVYQCNVAKQDMLPSFPGIIQGGFSSILIINENNEYIPLVCRINNLMFVEGVGLYLDDASSYSEDPLCKILYSEEDHYTFNLIRQAVKRLNEAMYIPDSNSRFVYLMTTLEVISSPEYIGFSEVRKIISALICSNRDEYLNTTHRLRDLSMIHRTAVVHNGKDIFDSSLEEMNKNLLFLQGIIVKSVYKIINSNAKTHEDFLAFIEEKKDLLGVQENEKIDEQALISELRNFYSGTEIFEVKYDDYFLLLENLKKNYLKKLHGNILKIN